MRLADPWLLLLFIGVLLLWVLRPRRGGVAFSGYTLAVQVLKLSRGPILWKILLGIGIGVLIVALARPQFGRERQIRSQEGRDLVLVVDLSGSMITDDMRDKDQNRIDRLRAVFDAGSRFIKGRPNDRIGLVFFGTDAHLTCPITYDHDSVQRILKDIEAQQRQDWIRRPPMVAPDSGLLGGATNIGLGLGKAFKALPGDVESDETRRGQAIVIITDGMDRKDFIEHKWQDPLVGASHATSFGITTHAIGVGNPDEQMTDRDALARGFRRLVDVPPILLPNMERLKDIAKAGDGVAMKANNREELERVFDRIDELEPTPKEIIFESDYTDRWRWPLAAGLLLVFIALILEPRMRGQP